MRIIYYNVQDLSDHGAPYLQVIQQLIPTAQMRKWQAGDDGPADYALVWKPPVQMLAGRTDLKAIFTLGAGVDAIMGLSDQIPAHVPIIRMEDAGMAEQMADYVSYALLRYFRHFGHYEEAARKAVWQPLATGNTKSAFPVAILGLGILGTVIAQRIQQLNFPVLGWSRTQKNLEGAACYFGADGLKNCLSKAQVVVCVLPLTADTTGILNRSTLSNMPKGAYLINVARGAHVVEADLVALLRSGQLAGATLDVVQTEPLPPLHPLWQQPNLTITPHIAAVTVHEQGNTQVAEKLVRLEQGLPVTGVINRRLGY